MCRSARVAGRAVRRRPRLAGGAAVESLGRAEAARTMPRHVGRIMSGLCAATVGMYGAMGNVRHDLRVLHAGNQQVPTDARTHGPAEAAAPPAHITTMTAYGYNASAQAGWCSWGKSFNLTELIQGFEQHGLPGLYRIDCVGCQELENGGGKHLPDPGFAAGVICDGRNCSTCPNVYHMCEKSRGDKTNWDEQTLQLLNLAKPHLISGALRGVFLGEASIHARLSLYLFVLAYH